MKENFYKMYPEHHFAVVKMQSKTLRPEDLEILNTEYKQDPDYSNIHHLLIIIDKKSKPSFNISYLTRLSEKYNTETQINNHKSIVWLISRPIITALTQLFIMKTNDNSHYCSTIEKAYKLLEIPIEFEAFKKLIDDVQL